MKPKILKNSEWLLLKEKFEWLNLEIWNSLDAVEKLRLLKKANIQINPNPVFGRNYMLKYPDDIYLKNISKLFKLDPFTLNKMKELVLKKEEVGGVINYDMNIEIDVLFFGDINRINLEFDSDAHSLFHTHPKQNISHDPPSVLDIISYLALIVKYIADLIIDLGNGVEHPADDPLVVQNSIVFTKDEIYIYYISKQLLSTITKNLIEIYMNGNFVFEVEKLLEEIEISYGAYLSKFNRKLNSYSLHNYLNELFSLGFLIKRYKYDSPSSVPEVYITL